MDSEEKKTLQTARRLLDSNLNVDQAQARTIIDKLTDNLPPSGLTLEVIPMAGDDQLDLVPDQDPRPAQAPAPAAGKKNGPGRR